MGRDVRCGVPDGASDEDSDRPVTDLQRSDEVPRLSGFSRQHAVPRHLPVHGGTQAQVEDLYHALQHEVEADQSIRFHSHEPDIQGSTGQPDKSGPTGTGQVGKKIRLDEAHFFLSGRIRARWKGLRERHLSPFPSSARSPAPSSCSSGGASRWRSRSGSGSAG